MANGTATPASTRTRIEERIPATINGGINAFATNVVSNYSGLIKNGIVENYANDPNRTYVTQRPALEIQYKAAATVADVQGRGIHYWSYNDNVYFMNDDIIYKGSYATPCSVQGGDTAIATGTSQVYFREWESANASYLFIIDPENSGIYVICSDAVTTVINLVDRSGSGTLEGFAVGDSWDFDALNAIIATDGLCGGGGVVLDTYLFLGTLTSARIYNSNVDDWLNWNALNFITCERANDQLLYLAKSKDHVVAVGERTIEVLYDNANATGSPLSFRKDIAHQIGTAGTQTVWEHGDEVHFLGVEHGGAYVLCTLSDFQVQRHENPTYNAYLWQSRYTENMGITLIGFSVGGHVYVIITNYSGTTPVKSVVYDAVYGFWYEWSTTVGTNTQFVPMGYSERDWTNTSRPAGILRNGDIFYIDADYTCVDTIAQVGSEATANIALSVITDNYDYGTTEEKYMFSCNYAGNATASSQTMTVTWTDDEGATTQSRTIDTNTKTQINRMGRFVKRKFTIAYSGSQQIRFEGLDVIFSLGSY